MKLVKALIAIAAIGVGSQAFGEVFPGLEVGFTFREVALVVADLSEDAKKIGLTEEDIERTVKLKLLGRGIKVVPKGEGSPTGSFIYISMNIVGPSNVTKIEFNKYALHFGIPLNRGTGVRFIPRQGIYASAGTHGGNKKFILDYMEGVLDKFILDYLESNIKYEATLKDKKLRDIDRVIKGAADAEVKAGVSPYTSQTAWYKRYNALMKEK